LRSLYLGNIMGGNQFTGSIPAEIGYLTNLENLDLRWNQFSGKIPNSLWYLPKLRILVLAHTQVSGELPPAIGNLSSLEILDLSVTGLYGQLPPELWTLTKLISLDLSGNHFTGPLPAEVGNLGNLGHLNLANNTFYGPIPPTIGDLTNLTILDIGSNHFFEEIPFEITYLVNLNTNRGYSNFGYNHLSSTNATVRDFLDDKDPDWESTQTPFTGFMDVPHNYWAVNFILAIKEAGITAGCGEYRYCPSAPVYRGDMAIFLERGMQVPGFTPPPAVGIFTDVPLSAYYANWVEQLYNDGVTGGCSVIPMKYCPSTKVTRAQMAVFLLKAKHGKEYQPPPAQGIFSDVPRGSFYEPYIEQLAAEGITAGCGVGIYCPTSAVTRAQMAVFLTRTFELPMD
jgi:hypothetical protein